MTDPPLPPPDPAAPDQCWRPEDDDPLACIGDDVHDADRGDFAEDDRFTTEQWESVEAARAAQGLT